ncbi:MAG: IS3 family transposase, partial [Acidimicrobiales bacterium]
MTSTETVVLAREVGRLREQAAITRRLAAFDDQGPGGRERIYRFVTAERENFSVLALCSVCGVSRSAYYAWASQSGEVPAATLEEATLANAAFDAWKRSKGAYGSPRVTVALWREGVPASSKRVAKLMAEIGIAGACGRKKMKTTRRDPTATPATDLVHRHFTADDLDGLWLTDLTYIDTDEGWLYLSSVMDVFSRRLLGWSIADHMRTELCTDALRAAAMVRGRADFTGTVLHSDHGSQFTSDDFKKRCRALHVVQSMGTVGDSYDNAMMESVWSSFKRELVYETHFSTKEEARQAVFQWIIWYNSE